MKLLLEVFFLILTILSGLASIVALVAMAYSFYDGALPYADPKAYGFASLALIPLIFCYICRYILNYIRER